MAAPRQLRNARRWNRPRPLFEELPSPDARWLARHNMVPRDWGRRIYDFSFINPAFGGLIITPRVCEVIFRDGRQQIVQVHWQSNGGMCLGTIRPLFGCPRCSNKCFKLFDLHGELNCKHCAVVRGAIYASQLGDGSRRRALQAIRLRHFLNGYAGLKPAKPAFMHRSTLIHPH
jgi:hypothetical protein